MYTKLVLVDQHEQCFYKFNPELSDTDSQNILEEIQNGLNFLKLSDEDHDELYPIRAHTMLGDELRIFLSVTVH